jgi:hypothetical protein
MECGKESGDLNFDVPFSHYGHVEFTYIAILHSVLDILMEQSQKQPLKEASRKTFIRRSYNQRPCH